METIWNFFASPAKDKPLLMDFLPLLLTLGVAIWGFRRAFRAWERQKKREIELALEQKRYESKIEACKAAWSLLVYMSEKENERTVFVDRGTAQNPTYMMRPEQGIEYIKKLPEVFFDKGHGIFLPPSIRDDAYIFRSKIYKILEAAKHNPNPDSAMVEVTKPQLKAEIAELRNQMSKNIREAVQDNRIAFEE